MMHPTGNVIAALVAARIPFQIGYPDARHGDVAFIAVIRVSDSVDTKQLQTLVDFGGHIHRDGQVYVLTDATHLSDVLNRPGSEQFG